MEIFLAGTGVTSNITLADSLGNRLVVDSLEYQVTDETGADVIPRAVLPSFTANDQVASVEVPAEKNELAPGIIRALRRVTLFCNVGGNTVVVESPFAIQSGSVLQTGVNSFQTFDEALLNAMDIPNITGWDSATTQQKIAAMVEARTRLCQLNYSLLDANAWAQDSLNFVPEGTRVVPYPSTFNFTGDITWLSVESFKGLPEYFLSALRKAQIAEASAILGGDEAFTKRRDGVVRDVVGESEQTYRSGKVLDLAVSRVSMRYLSRFVNFNLKLARV